MRKIKIITGNYGSCSIFKYGSIGSGSLSSSSSGS
jgi:hypothetical protein